MQVEDRGLSFPTTGQGSNTYYLEDMRSSKTVAMEVDETSTTLEEDSGTKKKCKMSSMALEASKSAE